MKKEDRRKGFLWSLRVVCFCKEKRCSCLLAKYFSYWSNTSLLFCLLRTQMGTSVSGQETFFLDCFQRLGSFHLCSQLPSVCFFWFCYLMLSKGCWIIEAVYHLCLMFLNTHIHSFKEKLNVVWWITKHIVGYFGHLSFSVRAVSFLDSVCPAEALNLLAITPSNPLSLLPSAKHLPSFLVCIYETTVSESWLALRPCSSSLLWLVRILSQNHGTMQCQASRTEKLHFMLYYCLRKLLGFLSFERKKKV